MLGHWKRALVVLAVALAGLAVLDASTTRALAVGKARAAAKADSTRSTRQSLKAALRLEVQGDNAKRNELLASAMEQAPNHPAARWHSGHVRYQEKWIEYDALPETLAEDRRHQTYRFMREKYPDTVQGQLGLAQWCAKNKLPDRQRAHLTRVLEADPDHAQARAMLGHRRVNGVWVSPAEIVASNAAAQREARALRQWIPRLTTLGNKVTRGSDRERRAALEQLKAISDPAAVSAIEQVFTNHSEGGAETALQMFSRINGHEASLALARQAVLSPFPPVRQAAAELLSSRDVDGYVPALLSAMVLPIQSRMALYRDSTGRTTYRHIFYREGQDLGQLAVMDTEYRPQLMPAGEDPEEWRQRVAQARRFDAAQKARARELALAQENARIQAFNARVSSVLAKATGEPAPPSPERWWDWWNDYNEVYVEDYKPVATYHQRNERVVNPGRAPIRPRRRKDCLAAGTCTWTDTGPKEIDKVRVGDLVLAQHVETGELAYKPVLRTTIRPAEELLRVETESDSFECSGGHPFWISGAGWVKARELEPGTYLHGITETSPVRTVGESGVQKTYNLVVADFHTYFVGEGRVLTHDNTVRNRTNAIVPGLLETD